MTVLEDLFNRNINWALTQTREDPAYFRRLAAGQKPRYLWIGCSDSRVPANEVVGLNPGDLFVHRNIANIVHTSDMNLLSALEYGVDVLGVEDVIVCGHYGCGGVKRAMEEGQSDLSTHWLAPIIELYRRHRVRLEAIRDDNARLNTLCELNVEKQVRRVAATPIMTRAWKAGRRVSVHGWVYGLNDGLLRDLHVTMSSLDDRDVFDANRERVERAVLRGSKRDAATEVALKVLKIQPPCNCCDEGEGHA